MAYLVPQIPWMFLKRRRYPGIAAPMILYVSILAMEVRGIRLNHLPFSSCWSGQKIDQRAAGTNWTMVQTEGEEYIQKENSVQKGAGAELAPQIQYGWCCWWFSGWHNCWPDCDTAGFGLFGYSWFTSWSKLANDVLQRIIFYSSSSLLLQYGLYGSFLGCFMYIFFGSCKDVPMGPTAIASLLTYQTADGIWQRAVLLSLLTGLIEVLMGLFGLGELTSALSTVTWANQSD